MEYDDVVKEFIDFVNLQVGVYMNSIAGFSGAKMQMERQVARVLRAQSRKKDARGDQVITHQSFEDPQRPDVVHSRIVTAENFIKENSPGGINQRQLSYSVIVFIYTYWEDEIRPRLAKAAGRHLLRQVCGSASARAFRALVAAATLRVLAHWAYPPESWC